jgi:hypothetical protein
VRAYEQAGVQATSRVQSAARVVVRQNAVLRGMVRELSGWTEGELDGYLASVSSDVEGRGIDGKAERCGGSGLETARCGLPADDFKESLTMKGTVGEAPLQRASSIAHTVRDPPPVCGINQRHTRNQTSNISIKRNSAAPEPEKATIADDDTTMKLRGEIHSDPSEIELSSSTYKTQQTPSMSCEEAAAIISSISFAGGAAHDIREKLGCTSVGTCSVNNMEVFDVMGESI